jgi:hypothetical protein
VTFVAALVLAMNGVHSSLVELRCRLLMNSRTAAKLYRTARPNLVKRGPVPFILAFANHDVDKPSSLATWSGWSIGSISFVFAALIIEDAGFWDGTPLVADSTFI